jgi:hypothetical protein
MFSKQQFPENDLFEASINFRIFISFPMTLLSARSWSNEKAAANRLSLCFLLKYGFKVVKMVDNCSGCKLILKYYTRSYKLYVYFFTRSYIFLRDFCFSPNLQAPHPPDFGEFE